MNKWKHSKSGKIYTILTDQATSSEDLTPLIVYQAEYGDKKIWVRPKYMWEEEVLVNDIMVPRFIKI